MKMGFLPGSIRERDTLDLQDALKKKKYTKTGQILEKPFPWENNSSHRKSTGHSILNILAHSPNIASYICHTIHCRYSAGSKKGARQREQMVQGWITELPPLFFYIYTRSNYTIVRKTDINRSRWTRRRWSDMVRGMNNIERRSEALALVDCFSELTDSVCQRLQSIPILIQTMNLAGSAKNTKWHLALNLHVESLRNMIEI